LPPPALARTFTHTATHYAPPSQDTKLADTRALIDKEQLVARVPQLANGYLFVRADETHDAQARGSEQRKGVAQHNFIHIHEGKPYIHIASSEAPESGILRRADSDAAAAGAVVAAGGSGGSGGAGGAGGAGGVLAQAAPAAIIGAQAAIAPPDGTRIEYIDMADLELGKKLGNGAYGDVLQAKLKVRPPGGQIIGIDVAVKMVTAKHANDLRARKDIVAENERLKQCDSHFVTRCFGTAKDPVTECLYIVLELCDVGDLKSHTADGHYGVLAGTRMCPVPHAEMVIITLQVLAGLAYVHGKGMVHRDIAARNIMIKKDKNIDGSIVAQLADLGMAREVGDGGYYSLKYTVDGDTIKIPVAWSPPESFEMQESESKDGDKKYTATQKLDLWAVAVTLYEMVTNCRCGRKKRGGDQRQGEERNTPSYRAVCVSYF
jgi:hypothetical protein